MSKHDVLSRLIGTLLLVAGSLKIWGLAGFQAISSRGLFATPGFQVVVVYLELLLGLWFLFSQNRGWRWLTALLLFCGFAAVNLYQGLEGQTSCGCFGPLRTNPWHVFGGDIVVVALLAWMRPDFSQDFASVEFRRYSAAGFGAAFIFVAFASAIFLASGSFDRAAALLRQESYSLSPSIVDFGSGDGGDIKSAHITINNWSEKPIRVVGGNSSCQFVASTDLPVTIEPGESQSLNMSVLYPMDAGRFDHQGYYYLDVDGLAKVRFRITGFSNGAK